MLIRFHTIPACHGQTDRITISISRVSSRMLTRDKNVDGLRYNESWSCWMHQLCIVRTSVYCRLTFFLHLWTAITSNNITRRFTLFWSGGTGAQLVDLVQRMRWAWWSFLGGRATNDVETAEHAVAAVTQDASRKAAWRCPAAHPSSRQQMEWM